MKRVLIFSLAYFPRFVGGAEVAIQEITNRLPKEDFEFHLITLRFDSELPREETIGNVRVHRIGFSRPRPSMDDLQRFSLYFNKVLFQVLACWKALRLHWKHPFQIVWGMMAHSTGIPAALFKTCVPSVRYVLNLQEGDPPEKIERLMRPFGFLFRRAFTKADVVQSISNFLQDWARRMGARGKLLVIPNGVERTRFSVLVSEEARAKMEKRLGKRAGEAWLCSTSRLVAKNATDQTILALKHLPESVHLAIAGIGPDEAMLRELVLREGLSERVHFLGEVSQRDIPALLQVCDIFVRPSRSEGLGISFLEAMATGIPVIATRVGGIPDFLVDAADPTQRDRSTGWAVAVDAPQEIAAAVQAVLHNAAETQSVTRRAQRMIETTYQWDAIVERIQRESFV